MKLTVLYIFLDPERRNGMLPIKTLARNGGLILRKYSPEILTGVGLLSTGVGTFLACKATYRVDEIIKPDNELIDKIESKSTDGTLITTDGTPYSENDKKTDLIKAKAQRAKHLALHYLPAGLCLIGGAASILAGHGILRKSQVMTAAALSAVEEGFRNYRGNVVEQLGIDADKMFRFNGQKITETKEIVDEETGEVTGEEEITRPTYRYKWESDNDPNLLIFSKLTCPDTFTGVFVNDINYIRARMGMANNQLHIEKCITRNDVCTLIGHSRNDIGLTWGKVAWDEDDPDYYVDFGIFDEEGQPFQWVYDYYAENEAIPIELNFQGNIDGKITRAMKMGGR